MSTNEIGNGLTCISYGSLRNVHLLDNCRVPSIKLKLQEDRADRSISGLEFSIR
jgi:hypothetical protein